MVLQNLEKPFGLTDLLLSIKGTKGPILKPKYAIVPDTWLFTPHPSTF